MALDKIYKKQLEQFGVEFTQAPDENLSKKQRQEFAIIEADVMKALMGGMQGRQWLYSKLDMCKIFSTPFVPSDSHGTAFFAGIQAVGQNLLDDIMRNAPENFSLMLQEAAARFAVKKED